MATATRTVVTLSVALGVVVGLIICPPLSASAEGPAYTDLTSAKAIGDPNIKGVVYALTAAGKIPKKVDAFISSKLCFGYGWIGDPHVFNGIGDPNQRPGVITTMGAIPSALGGACGISGPEVRSWDTQTVTISKPNGDACIVGVANPPEKLSVRTNMLTTKLATADATIFPSTFELAASFELQVDTIACPVGTTTGLKVVPIDTVVPGG